ncbi:putative permease [Roseovarius albus]|uniref:Putative permease n=1 Tax=Roseovarius albus TaxID=1247867 RepID=A0A1X6Z3X0_9RHOB|nr:permease [Roseovarius albus]SLN39773.1 putative permease [Roseovarius albus]
MTDTTVNKPLGLVRGMDKVWLALAVILALLALLDWPQFIPAVQFASKALLGTAPFIAFAVFAVAYLKATGAETLLAKAFQGNTIKMIFVAALVGGLAPFCSCEVIPFIAAMLALGAPLAAVMAFWLASPLMDPAMFLITSGTLGWDFAMGKTLAAVGVGLFGGFATLVFARSPLFNDPLREIPKVGCSCGSNNSFDGIPQWRFWTDADRLTAFKDSAFSNAKFLIKWLALAYVIEALMLAYIPAETVARILGGEGIGPIILGAIVGAPAYLNGYAAVPLIDALLAQGMSQGAAMSFVIAGGISSIPAAIAVWALVKPRVFAAYLGFAITGAIMAGLLWQTIAA